MNNLLIILIVVWAICGVIDLAAMFRCRSDEHSALAIAGIFSILAGVGYICLHYR